MSLALIIVMKKEKKCDRCGRICADMDNLQIAAQQSKSKDAARRWIDTVETWIKHVQRQH